MASVLQSVFNIKEFQNRYNNQLAEHAKTCTAEPANCWLCQLHKIADGLLSGRYSQPIAPKNENDSPSQDGISPAMFKQLVGRGHEEFSTMRQQDAFEFFLYLLKSVQQKEHALKQCNPTEVFDFTTEQRLECSKCNKVRYQCDQTNAVSVNVPAREVQGAEDGVYEAVNIYECLDNFVQPEVVEGYNCPQCNEKTVAYRSVKFKTFPQVLVINPRRFAFINWVPQKLSKFGIC
jgi:ubiquitin carboxyl-terminal hydrolase 5/13